MATMIGILFNTIADLATVRMFTTTAKLCDSEIIVYTTEPQDLINVRKLTSIQGFFIMYLNISNLGNFNDNINFAKLKKREVSI